MIGLDLVCLLLDPLLVLPKFIAYLLLLNIALCRPGIVLAGPLTVLLVQLVFYTVIPAHIIVEI